MTGVVVGELEGLDELVQAAATTTTAAARIHDPLALVMGRNNSR
jgi:hypothetical protein